MCGVMVVDAGRSQSTCLRHDAYIHDHCLRHLHNYSPFYQLLKSNLLPIVCFLSREKPLVKTMAPGSIFYHIIFRSIKSKTQKYLAAIYLPLSYFVLLLIFYIYHYQISSLQVPWRDWQPLYRIGCKYLFVCVGAIIGDLCVPPTGLIPWFSTEEIFISTLLHYPFLFKGKPTQAQEVAGRISGAVAGEIYVKLTKYPS